LQLCLRFRAHDRWSVGERGFVTKEAAWKNLSLDTRKLPICRTTVIIPLSISHNSALTNHPVTAITAKQNSNNLGQAPVHEEVHMFKVGEKVVYPAHGVGEIEAIRTHVISGTEKKFYMLRILETDMKIMIPIDNVDSVGLRKIIDRAMVTKVYKVLRQKKVETDQQTWNRRYREYTEKIKTGSILEIAKVLRDLFVLKGDKELSFGERKMLDTARNLLVKELSIARSHSEEKIMEELRHIFTH
jgi:CarD family transcriptional regulator